MKIRKFAAPLALLASGALVLSACGTSEDPKPGASNTTTSPGGSAAPEGPGKADLGEISTKDDTISYTLGGEEWLGYNNNTPETYSTYNSVINDRLIGGFIYFGTDGSIHQDPEFGTFKLTSEEPMVVEYTLADNATWSDGTPIAYEDYLLDWAAQAMVDGKNDDGSDKPLFNHVGGLDFGGRVLEGPKGEVGGKTFSYEYKDPYPDYQLQVGGAFPSHIVAEQAGMTVEELVKAIQDKDIEKLRPAAKFWNEGWLSNTPGTLPDPAITPVSGPYKLKSWEAGQSVTLEANEKYFGTPAATKTLVYRFVSPDAQVQALANGDLNIIEPQAVVDTVAQVKALGDSVKTEAGQSLTWEHLDFNFNSGVFKDSLELREAFAMCVPRQQIVDNLVKPVDPEAVVMNAREVFPFQDNYADVVSAAYKGQYDQVDIEGAKAKIAAAGVETPVKVRIGYSAPNPRRTNEVALIKSSCDEAGFEITDVGNKDFFAKTLPNGDYEVALFAWAGSGQIVSGQNIYSSTGQQNYGGYKNETVDKAWETLGSTLDTAKQQEQVKIIEKELWDTLYGIPLFAHPGLVAYDATISNVRKTATQSTVAWNAEQWVRAS
ncbi:ABC transporter family substrate-binding protein [Flavimobilis sp. GY10621]|uniref:ABC transporter family substrate-binding protein n=1 Tax=Flavimobilis rhizosphaerae TaxID=2775421 RepID=A0ABR9DMR7_9MICO|nr:ABC transporter substrate-binding protein [Flavimobilis rhizosphaerae]MBD9698408.1 ABC transporter family substrate-binding protein [Flavimobilis rhizosphaerae]